MRNMSLIVGVVAVLSASAAAQEQLVTIEGGGDPSGQNYQWTVTNRHTSPIVRIEFPHYFADTFVTPAGWKQDCTNMQRLGGGKDAPGVCIGTADTTGSAIAAGATGQFSIRLAKGGRAMRGSGVVVGAFADGREFRVSGVFLPVAPSALEGWGTVIICAVAFVVFLLVQLRRRKRATVAAESPGAA